MTTYTHDITLYNMDLRVDWKFTKDGIDVTNVYIIYNHNANLLKFLSKEVLDLIIWHINFYELGRE
jgi:hypothetical protein